MTEGMDAVDISVCLTSFVLIALHKASTVDDRILQLRSHEVSMDSAATYIASKALNVKSVYVRAMATYALTLRRPDSMDVFQLITSLENLARQKGNPVERRYWQEASEKADWRKPDESSAMTVETTAYVLMTILLKGRLSYAKPIVAWLTQDQNYGEGFFSVEDMALTIEAVSQYNELIPKAVLNQHITIDFPRTRKQVKAQLTQTRPVTTPILVEKNDVITVSTGYGKGVSNVKLKAVYYETSSTSEGCNFDLTIEVRPRSPNNPRANSPNLVACAKFKPPPGEDVTESTLTVMRIELPTGVDAYLEDLRQFKDGDKPMISHYELQGNTMVIQLDSVPSDVFMCVGFRIRIGFNVRGVTDSLFTVNEPEDRGSMCVKTFSYQEQKLQQLCLEGECQCMTAACSTYRAALDNTLTLQRRISETCQPHIKYAFRVTIKSSAADGDFVTYTAVVNEVLRNTDKDFQAVTVNSEVDLIKKVTCNVVDIQNNKQYLVMGARGSEVTLNNAYKYRLALDSEALVELWPTDCRCSLEELAQELQLEDCPAS